MHEPDSLDTPRLLDVAHMIGRVILAVMFAPIIAGPMFIYRVVRGLNDKDDPRCASRASSPDDVRLAAVREHPSIGTLIAEISKPMLLAVVVAFLVSPAGSLILLGVIPVVIAVAAVLSGPGFILMVVRSVNRADERRHVNRPANLPELHQPLCRPEEGDRTERTGG